MMIEASHAKHLRKQAAGVWRPQLGCHFLWEREKAGKGLERRHNCPAVLCGPSGSSAAVFKEDGNSCYNLTRDSVRSRTGPGKALPRNPPGN